MAVLTATTANLTKLEKDLQTEKVRAYGCLFFFDSFTVFLQEFHDNDGNGSADAV